MAGWSSGAWPRVGLGNKERAEKADREAAVHGNQGHRPFRKPAAPSAHSWRSQLTSRPGAERGRGAKAPLQFLPKETPLLGNLWPEPPAGLVEMHPHATSTQIGALPASSFLPLPVSGWADSAATPAPFSSCLPSARPSVNLHLQVCWVCASQRTRWLRRTCRGH